MQFKSKLIRFFRRNEDTLASATVQESIDEAQEMHRGGDLEGASRLYRSLSEAFPNHAETYYRFGNLLKQQGALPDALEMYDRAIELKRDYSQAHCNKAVLLGLLDRPIDALNSYDCAIAIDPADSIAHCNKAMLLIGLGQKDSALASFEAALKNDPTNFAALFGRGALFQERKQWQESLAAYQCALAVNSTDAAGHYNIAVVAMELKRWSAALESTETAIALNPNFSGAYAKRAEILQELKQYSTALSSFDAAIRLSAADANAFSNRGVLRQTMGDFGGALIDYEHALALNPNNAEAWFNRGAALKELDDSKGALASYDRALELRRNYGDAYVNRGVALQDEGLILEAIASYNTAIAQNPELPEAHYNLALASLTVGDYSIGWSEYEWRWRAKGGPIFREKRDFSEPLWIGGKEITGKRILLYGEQGLGDSLLVVRYVDMVAKLGSHVILEVPAPLVTLFSNLPGAGEVIAYGTPLPHFDVQCPLMSLPLAFNTTLETIPSPKAYLSSDPAKVTMWQQRLGIKAKPRIGLTWSGNQAAGTNRKRHFALSRLIPYLPEGYDYFCLQTDVVAADQQALNNSEIFQFQGLLRDFSDTAALCACMDLIVSVDTSVAHLACALGKATWILLAYAADWRWLLDRTDSPWYASARLLRQKSDGAWDHVFEGLVKDMRDRSLASD